MLTFTFLNYLKKAVDEFYSKLESQKIEIKEIHQVKKINFFSGKKREAYHNRHK